MPAVVRALAKLSLANLNWPPPHNASVTMPGQTVKVVRAIWEMARGMKLKVRKHDGRSGREGTPPVEGQGIWWPVLQMKMKLNWENMCKLSAEFITIGKKP